MHNFKCTRLCLILPADVNDLSSNSNADQHGTPAPEKKQQLLDQISSKKQRKQFRRRLASFFRSIKLKWVEFYHRQPHPSSGAVVVPHSPQLFKDTDGVALGSSRVHPNAPRIFSYAELYIGTSGFSETEILGSGGFGRVYRAVLPSDGTVVAVKCVADKAEKMEKTFLAELAAVAQLRHRNLVPLRGWCVHEDELLLVYDYMPNRSLDRILFKNGSGSSDPLPWDRRHKIVFGLAAALFYLHEQLDTQIIHRDIKTSNVMLDSKLEARLGDFGLARWLEHDLKSASRRTTDHQFRLADTSHIGGTIGYLPPESFSRSRSATSVKSDVFSFGVVLLEIASGRRAVDLSYPDKQIILLDWIRTLSDKGNVLKAADARLPDGSYELTDMKRAIQVGLLCTVNDPKTRPTMKWVIEMLVGAGDVAGDLPALPTFRAHPRYITLSSSSSSSSSSAVTISFYNTADSKTIYLTADAGESSEENSGEEEFSGGSSANPPEPVFPAVDAPREIPYKEILAATNQFSLEQMVAEMDFGTAYHGYLDGGRQRVVIKRLGMKTCPALRARFSDEFRNLGSLRHRNLVQLRGWCTEHGEMLVVYDYLPHRSLTHLLFSGAAGGGTKLGWSERYAIVKSLASAVLYLHEEWEEQVIHRSINSTAIIIDPDNNPKLGSFALAEFLTRNSDGHHGDHEHHHPATASEAPRGIFGYMSPEYMESGSATTATDVYSFGVVVLELVTGQRAVDLRRPEVLLVRKIRDREGRRRPVSEVVDYRLGGEYDKVEAERLLRLGLVCTRSDPALRPNMGQVVSVLDGKDHILRRVKSPEEKREEWERKNESALTLVKRLQALGIH